MKKGADEKPPEAYEAKGAKRKRLPKPIHNLFWAEGGTIISAFEGVC